MYKSIIPGLVTFDTGLTKVNGFVMCQNFDFYPKASEKGPFHYSLIQTQDIRIPDSYDFRSEYYLKKGEDWYFNRQVFVWHPIFRYDSKAKVFYVNKDYLRLPFRVGGMHTLGEHLSNFIDFELFLKGYVILRGIALQINGKNVGISAPGFNGKTTLLKRLLHEGAAYIAEDYLIIHPEKSKLYPTCPLAEENFWRRRKIGNTLKNLLSGGQYVKEPVQLDDLYLAQNSKNPSFEPVERGFGDFLLLNSLYFLDNLFIRSFIFDAGLTGQLFDRISALKKHSLGKFVKVINFNYNLEANKMLAWCKQTRKS